MKSFRRFSLAPNSGDGDLDNNLFSLYPPDTILDARCIASIRGESLSPSTLIQDDEKAKSKETEGDDDDEFEKADAFLGIKVQLKNTSTEEVIASIPPEYFTSSYDPIIAHLEEISTWPKVNQQSAEIFMKKIEKTDMQKDKIVLKLTKMIDENYDDLMLCMKKVQEIDMELLKANLTVSESRRNLQSSKEIILEGPLKIQNLNKKKEKLLYIIDTIYGLKAINDLHKDMLKKIASNDLGQAAEIARNILQCLHNNSFNKFHALNHIISNTKSSLNVIKLNTNKILKRNCTRNFSVNEYNTVMKSYMILDHLEESQLVSFNNNPDLDSTSSGSADNNSILYDSLGCIDGLAQRINRFQLAEIDVCFQTAIMQNIYSISSSQNPMLMDDFSDLSEVPINILFRRLPSNLLPLCIIKSCQLLTDLIHVHYLICQWHSSPFDSRNEDILFLSRQISHKKEEDPSALSPSTQIHTDGDVSPSDEININLSEKITLQGFENETSLVKSFPSLSSCTVTLDNAPLINVLDQLIHSRLILWDEIVRSLVLILNTTTFSSEITVEDFVKMLCSFNLLIKLGKEFSGSDSLPLAKCIKEKSKEFFINYHSNSFQLIKLMAESELWKSIPITMNNESVLDIVKSSATRDLMSISLHQFDEENLKKSDDSEAILSNFHKTGNPFRFIDLITKEATESSSELFPSYFLSRDILGGIVDIITIMSESVQRVSSKKSQEYAVVTQTVLNGVAKYCIKYLNLIALMPNDAAEICDSLFQIFDYYLYVVFMSFITGEDRIKFLSKPTKNTAPPPDDSLKFLDLQENMERIISEVISLSQQEDSDSPISPSSKNEEGASPSSVDPTSTYEALRMDLLLSNTPVMFETNSSNCYALNERIVAAESCAFVAQILTEVKPYLLKFLPAEEVEKCNKYISVYSQVAGQLRSLLYKTVCPLVIQHNVILNQIIDSGWNSNKNMEEHHDWVDKLVQSCKNIWDIMLHTNHFADSTSFVRYQLWLELCQACFEVVLEGYCRVKKCSAEGRALMSKDVFALHEGLNNIHICNTPRGKYYIDSFMKCFYISEEEIMAWIHENWQSYSYRHIAALLSQTLSSSILNQKKLKDAMQVIDNLYEVDSMKETNTSTFSSMLSNLNRKDGTQFSNLLNVKFRRNK